MKLERVVNSSRAGRFCSTSFSQSTFHPTYLGLFLASLRLLFPYLLGVMSSRTPSGDSICPPKTSDPSAFCGAQRPPGRTTTVARRTSAVGILNRLRDINREVSGRPFRYRAGGDFDAHQHLGPAFGGPLGRTSSSPRPRRALKRPRRW